MGNRPPHALAFSAFLVLATAFLLLAAALLALFILRLVGALAYSLALITLPLLLLLLLVAFLVCHDCSSSGASDDTNLVSGPLNRPVLEMFLRPTVGHVDFPLRRRW